MEINDKKSVYWDSNASIEDRIEDLLSQMTLEEKIAQLGSQFGYIFLEERTVSQKNMEHFLEKGIGEISRLGSAIDLTPQETAQVTNKIQYFLRFNTRLGIPAIFHEECLAGYVGKGATAFPQMIGIGATWDPELLNSMTSCIREQMRAVGMHQGLSPVLDLAHDARWGRVEECFGEDPYLVSKFGVSYVRGLQGDSLNSGILATAKHFVGYGSPTGGRNWGMGLITQRELLEHCARPFEAVIRQANLASIMNAYHEIDGLPCGFTSYFLTDLLRKQLGFTGFVVSDYFTISLGSRMHQYADTPAKAAKLAINAGLDIELPKTEGYGISFREMVQKGEISENVIDQAVRRVLKAKFALGLFDNPFVSEDFEKIQQIYTEPRLKQLAKELALKSIVLLKNEKNVLPLQKNIRTIAVLGPSANKVRHLFGDYSFVSHFESTAINVTGNRQYEKKMQEYLQQQLNPNDRDAYSRSIYNACSVLEAIKNKISATTEILFEPGCDILGTDKSGFQEAIQKAKLADVVIFVGGERSGLVDDCTCGESRDRIEITLPGVQSELLKDLSKLGVPIVLVLLNGRPLSISWEKDHIPAILEAWLPGEEGGNAIADILFGDYNPSGKLPITFPRAVGQIPIYHYMKPTGLTTVWTWNYVEINCSPLFPFGYGLSYTRFEYSQLTTDPPQVSVMDSIRIGVMIENQGSIAGDEVVQLYLRDVEADVTRPIEQLFGFKRISLKPSERVQVIFTLPMSALGFYNQAMEYIVEPGDILIYFGSVHPNFGNSRLFVMDYFNPRDVKIQGKFTIFGKKRILAHSEKTFFSDVEVIPISS